jgi:hypothetical protein
LVISAECARVDEYLYNPPTFVLRSPAFQEELFHCIPTLPALRLQTRLGLSEYFIKSVLARWVPFFAPTTLNKIVS